MTMNAIPFLFLLFLAVFSLRNVIIGAIALIALALAVAAAYAAPVVANINPVIDQVQAPVAAWIADLMVSAFFAAATWLGGIIGVRVIEKLNRATMREAAERFANGIIDQVQARYVGEAAPDLTDLVNQGIGYIKTGNAGTVKQSKISDDRLGAYVAEAIQKSRVIGVPGLLAAPNLATAGAA